MNLTTINFKPLGDARGSLVAIESDLGIPFPIRRVYYIFDTKTGVERGFHAHKKLQQIAVAVTGSCEMILDDGKETERARANLVSTLESAPPKPCT